MRADRTTLSDPTAFIRGSRVNSFQTDTKGLLKSINIIISILLLVTQRKVSNEAVVSFRSEAMDIKPTVDIPSPSEDRKEGSRKR